MNPRPFGVRIRLWAAAAAVALIAAPVAHATAADLAPVKIALVFAFTGPDVSGGQEFNSAIAAFIKEHGDTIDGHKIVFTRHDTGGPNPEIVKRMVQEAIVNDKADIIIGLSYTPDVLAAAAISTQAKTPLFIVNASTSNIMANAPYMVRFGFTSGQVAAPLAQWAAKNGIHTVYNLMTDYGPGIDAGQQFSKAFEAAGGKMLGEVRVPLYSPDFTPFVARVKDAKPDAVFVFLGAGPEAARFLKASDEIGLRKAGIKILAAGSVLEQDQLDSIGAPTLGIVSTYHYSMVHDSALNRTFVKDFTAAAPPGLRPNFAAIQSYDALTAAYKVIAEQNGVVDPDKTMELVKQLKFESPRGPIEIDPATRDIVQNIYVRRVEKRGDLYVNAEFQTFPMVKDPVEH